MLWLDGEDMRARPTLERKLLLEELVRDRAGILYARHFARRGVDRFRIVCKQDLEGIVAKHTLAPYGSEQMPWIVSFDRVAQTCTFGQNWTNT